MKSICGADCCSQCGRREECGGCQKTDGIRSEEAA